MAIDPYVLRIEARRRAGGGTVDLTDLAALRLLTSGLPDPGTAA